MSFERERKIIDYDQVMQSIVEDIASGKGVEKEDADSRSETISPSELALSEFRAEYAKRVREAFSCENDP